MTHEINDTERQKAQEAGIRFYASPEEKEWAYLQKGLARTDKERFLFLMNLIKMQRAMSRATIGGK